MHRDAPCTRTGHRPPEPCRRPTRTRPAVSRAPATRRQRGCTRGCASEWVGKARGTCRGAGLGGAAPAELQQHICNPHQIAAKCCQRAKRQNKRTQPRAHVRKASKKSGSIMYEPNLRMYGPDSNEHHSRRTPRAAPAQSSTMCSCWSMPKNSRRWRGNARQASDAHPVFNPGEQHGVAAAMGSTEERGSANTAASLTRNGEKGRGGGVFARPR